MLRKSYSRTMQTKVDNFFHDLTWLIFIIMIWFQLTGQTIWEQTMGQGLRQRKWCWSIFFMGLWCCHYKFLPFVQVIPWDAWNWTKITPHLPRRHFQGLVTDYLTWSTANALAKADWKESERGVSPNCDTPFSFITRSFSFSITFSKVDLSLRHNSLWMVSKTWICPMN